MGNHYYSQNRIRVYNLNSQLYIWVGGQEDFKTTSRQKSARKKMQEDIQGIIKRCFREKNDKIEAQQN